MIQAIMYFGIGFLFASLIGIAVIPLVHARAVRLTLKRVENSIPQSMAEIQADKDLLRAEFAIQARRLEIDVEQLKDKAANQFAELGRKTDVINRLKIQHEAQNVETVALKTELEALKKELGRRDVTMPAVAYQRHDLDVLSLVPKDWPRSEPSQAPIELPQAAMLDAPQRHESEVVSLVVPRTNETARDGGPHGPDAAHGSSDQPIELPRAPSGTASVAESPIQVSHEDQVAHERPSVRRRVSRNVARLVIAGVLGAGAAIAWRNYGDQIGDKINTWAKPFDRLLFARSAKSPPPAVSEASKPSEMAKQIDAATSAVSGARNPADQLVAKQEQADNSGAPPPAADPNPKEEAQAAKPAKAAQAAEDSKETPQAAAPPNAQSNAPQTQQVAQRDANQKVASVAPETRPTTQPYPETRPTTIAGWALIEVVDGMAVVQGPNGVWRVRHGDTVPGVGRVDSIVRWGNRWIVATSKGLISTP
jgi:hypothetical protein